MKSGVRKPNQEELNLINQHYSKRELGEEELYVFDAFACDNNTVTAYFSRLGTDMIEAFNRDVNQRHTNENGLLIGYLFGHDNKSIPSGTLFKSELVTEKIDGKDVKRFKPSVFMLKNLNVGGINTDDYIRAYEAGHTEDCSVGFMAASYTCDICQQDIRSFECRHVPGRSYVMNEDEVRNGAPAITKQCTYTVHQGFVKEHNLAELSGVYRGAMWGARIESQGFSIGKDGVAKQVVDIEGNTLASTNIKDFKTGDILRFNFQFDGSIEKVGSELPKQRDEEEEMKRLAKNLSLSEADKITLNDKIQKLSKEVTDLRVENKGLKSTIDGYVAELRERCRKLSVAIWGTGFDEVLFKEEIKGLSIPQLRSKVANLEEQRARQIPVGRKSKDSGRIWGKGGREESQQQNSDLYKIPKP